jgi:ribose transport system substrate-binding protein
MRRLIAAATGLWLAAVPMGASAEQIGAVLTGYVHGFWRGVTKGMVQAADDFDVDPLVRSPADGKALDEQKNIQLRLMDYLAMQGVSAIVLAPEPLDGVPVPVTIPHPLVLVDRDTGEYRAAAAVTTDNFAAGRTAALSLAPVLRKGAKVAILRLAANIPSTSAREAGFAAVAREKGWDVVIDTHVGYKFREAEELTAKALGGYGGRLDAVFVPNETVAYGAVRVVKAMPPSSRPRLVAFDWRKEFREALDNGTLYATVLQDNFRMGYQSVATAVATLRGTPVETRQFVDVAVATKANANDPLIRRMKENYED